VVRSVSGTRACDEGVFFLFFSIRGSRRRSISGEPPLPSSPFFLSSNTSCTPFPSIPITLILRRTLPPSLGFSLKIRFWSVAVSGGREERERKGER